MRSQYGTGVAYSDAQMGAYGAGLGLTEAQANGFSLNLKNLYEGLTGIALP
jgi:ATP phosphoribosyltransferase regulatory subunit HisZ